MNKKDTVIGLLVGVIALVVILVFSFYPSQSWFVLGALIVVSLPLLLILVWRKSSLGVKEWVKKVPGKVVTAIRGKKDDDVMFWRQHTFWGCSVLALGIFMFLPIILTSWLFSLTAFMFPIELSCFRIEIVFFLIFLVAIYFLRNHVGKTILAWLAISLLIGIEGLSITITQNLILRSVVLITLTVLIVQGLYKWFKNCFKQVGTTDLPSQAVFARFGVPTKAVGPGLYFIIYKFEDIKLFPTGQYNFNYVLEEGLYTKAKTDKHMASLPLKVKISFYLRFPKLNGLYSFPKVDRKGEVKIKKVGRRNVVDFGSISGSDLLIKLYQRLPVKDLSVREGAVALKEHFKEAILGGVRDVMSRMDSSQCKEKKAKLEDLIKLYLLTEMGDPFFECGIPQQCISIELTSVKLPDVTEEAHMQPEIAYQKKEAAKFQKETNAELTKALVDQGVNPDFAALIAVAGMEGRKVDFAELRDYAIWIQSTTGDGLKIGGPKTSKKTSKKKTA